MKITPARSASDGGEIVKIELVRQALIYGIIYPLSSTFSTILISRLHCAADGSDARFI